MAASGLEEEFKDDIEKGLHVVKLVKFAMRIQVTDFRICSMQ